MQRYSKQIKNEVIKLRVEKGLSLGKIRKITDIPKTTIHKWIKNFPLANEQKLKIKNESLMLLQSGRIAAQAIRKRKKFKKERQLLEKGKDDIGHINARELFIAGIALYWAEGFKNKHEHRLGFCNSDSNMIKFYVHWLEKCLGINRRDLTVRLALNIAYKEKTKEIERYWSNIIGISLSQFTKPFYQNSLWKKQFSDSNYHGVLRIHVQNSLERFLEMKGWIKGLELNLPT